MLVFNEYLIPPIGTEKERYSGQVWPGHWVDVNPYANHYKLRKLKDGSWKMAYHTGADLNLNNPHWDSDRHKPVFSIGYGIVIAAGEFRSWGNIVVVMHKMIDGQFVYSRYAHLGEMEVEKGHIVGVGQRVGTVGRDAYNGPYHLHFDISLTDKLNQNPADWPGLDLKRIKRDYVDPKQYLLLHGYKS